MTVRQRLRWAARVAVTLAVAGNGAAQGQVTEPGDALTLHQAVELALDQHPTVRAARAAVAEARASAGQAAADRLPYLGMQATATRFQEPMIVAPFHALDLTSPPEFDRTLLQGSLQLGYTVFDGGARGARIDGARASAAAADERLAAVRMELIAAVTRAYLAVLSADGVRRASEASLDALRAERDRAVQFFEEGRAARVELLRVDAAIAQAEATHHTVAARLDAAEHALARLVGVARANAADLRPVALAVAPSAAPRAALLGRLDERDPDVAEAARRLEAAESARRTARAGWYPTLQLVGGYLAFGSAAGDVTAEWQAGLKLTYALFSGGARSHAVAAADARAALARERYELARLESANRLDAVLTEVRALEARVAATARAAEHLDEVVRIEGLALETGAGTQTDFLRAEAQRHEARAQLVEARHAHIAALVDLARATGDLSAAWLAERLESAP
jgi:outer membrane protein TolC